MIYVYVRATQLGGSSGGRPQAIRGAAASTHNTRAIGQWTSSIDRTLQQGNHKKGAGAIASGPSIGDASSAYAPPTWLHDPQARQRHKRTARPPWVGLTRSTARDAAAAPPWGLLLRPQHRGGVAWRKEACAAGERMRPPSFPLYSQPPSTRLATDGHQCAPRSSPAPTCSM